jgi:hypothetical protein
VAGAVLAFIAGYLLRGLFGKKADAAPESEKSEEVRREIENTPAGDLVAVAPDAEQLRANAAGIAGKFRERLRNQQPRPKGTGVCCFL